MKKPKSNATTPYYIQLKSRVRSGKRRYWSVITCRRNGEIEYVNETHNERRRRDRIAQAFAYAMKPHLDMIDEDGTRLEWV